MMDLKYLVTSHSDPNLSGVAKFGSRLAAKLNIPYLAFSQAAELSAGPILLSVKIRDCAREDLQQVAALVRRFNDLQIVYDIFFHTFDKMDIEYQLIKHCRKIYCGNAQIQHLLADVEQPKISAWCPSLIDSHKTLREKRCNLFSFGMAHKIRVEYYQKLASLLQKYQTDYSLWVSTAFHEKANFGDFDAISMQLRSIFEKNIQFMGFLSDDAVNYFLDKTQLFIAFFEEGVRANNTSVIAAMCRGCAVLTNCDPYSPSWMRHRHNILDIYHLDVDCLELTFLQAIADNAHADANRHANWQNLLRLFDT